MTLTDTVDQWLVHMFMRKLTVKCFVRSLSQEIFQEHYKNILNAECRVYDLYAVFFINNNYYYYCHRKPTELKVFRAT